MAKKMTKKSVLTEEFVREVAAENQLSAVVAVNLFRALTAYADAQGKKLTVAWLEKIPAETKIPKVGTTGRWLIGQMALKLQ